MLKKDEKGVFYNKIAYNKWTMEDHLRNSFCSSVESYPIVDDGATYKFYGSFKTYNC